MAPDFKLTSAELLTQRYNIGFACPNANRMSRSPGASAAV
jgi:hypothetical protein